MGKRNIFLKPKYRIAVMLVIVIFVLSLQAVRAWTEPTAAPPSGNVGAPVTTGDTLQIKDGNLIINALYNYSMGLFVKGQVKIQDGFQGAGKVLTSDADGLASWQPAGASILQQVYPVGSIYTSVSSTNPNTLFGFGTWVEFGSGRSLVGFNSGDSDFNTIEKQIGEKNHTLTQAEMPSHYHTVDPPNTNTGGHSADHAHYVSGYTGGITANHKHGPNDGSSGAVEFIDTKVSGTGNVQRPSSGNNAVFAGTTGYVSSDHTHWWGAWTGGVNTNHTHGVDIGQFNSGSLGSGTAFNNLQPSIVVYFFKRTE